MNNQSISFKILNEEEINCEFMGCEDQGLTRLNGCTDNDDELGLGIWTYQFEIEVNKGDEKRIFTVAFQPEDRSDGMKAYNPWDLNNASVYGYDYDQSDEVEKFCDYDSSILDELLSIATKAAQNEFFRLMENKDNYFKEQY